MKTTLLALFFLFCVASVAAQSAPVLSNQAAVVVIPDHPEHATIHEMGQEQNLFGNLSPYTYAQGEQPLWQFATEKHVTPLGDIARNLRKEHEIARKAEIVWESE